MRFLVIFQEWTGRKFRPAFLALEEHIRSMYYNIILNIEFEDSNDSSLRKLFLQRVYKQKQVSSKRKLGQLENWPDSATWLE